jgi:hypothetical protein
MKCRDRIRERDASSAPTQIRRWRCGEQGSYMAPNGRCRARCVLVVGLSSSADFAGRLGGATSWQMRSRIASGRWACRGLKYVLGQRPVTRNVQPRHAVSGPRAGRFASVSDSVLRVWAAEAVGLTPGEAFEFAKRPGSAFDHRRRASGNSFEFADTRALLMLRCAGRIPGRREEWDRELFEKTGARGLRHGFASIGDLPALALEHAASDTGVDFRFDPLFDNLHRPPRAAASGMGGAAQTLQCLFSARRGIPARDPAGGRGGRDVRLLVRRGETGRGR